MKRIIFSIFVVLLLGFSLVNAATSDLQILPIAAVSGNPGEIVNIPVQVKNNGASSIAVVNVASSNLTFDTNTITAPAATSITSLGTGQTKTGTLSLTIPSVAAGSYVGTVSVRDASDSASPMQATYAVSVNSVDGITVLNLDETTGLKLSGQEDEVRTSTFQIKNTGSTIYTPQFNYDSAGFTDQDEEILLTFSVPGGTIAPGVTKTVTVNADIPNKIDIDTYEGIITVTGGTATDLFKLGVSVQPEVCKDGPVGNELRIDVNEPDSGDDFAPGDTIPIDINVENDGDRKDVVVEAFLYNIDEDDEVERVESEATRIGEDEDEDFELDIELPFDDEITEDDQYILFIKAFEDGDEDKHCAEEQLDISIERESNDVRIQRVTLTPTTVKAGEFFEATVEFINVGSKDEDDVFVRLSSAELGIDETSNPVNLDDGESKDNDGTARFSGLLVPRNAKPGSYSISAAVNFNDGDDQADNFGTLTVIEGEAEDEEPEANANALRLQSVSDNGENAFTANVVVVNDGTSAKTYDLSVDASWAKTVSSQIFTVSGGDSRVVQILVNAKDDTETGSYSGVITLEEDGEVIDTETFNVAVTGTPETAPGTTGITGLATGNLLKGTAGTVLFVIVDIVLVIIAIFFIRMIFKSDRKKPRVTEKVKL